MNLNNLRISTRLSLGFGAVLALLLVIVVIAYSRLASTNTGLHELLKYQEQAELAQVWYSKTQLNVSRAIALAKTAGQPEVQAYFDPLVKKTSGEITAIQQKLETMIDSAEGKELMAAVAKKRAEYIASRNGVFESIKQVDQVAAEAQLKDKMLPASEAYLAAMAKVQTLQDALASQDAKRLDDGIRGASIALLVLLVLLAASLAVGAAMAFVITRSVTVPLRQAVDAARVIAASDLSQPVDSQRKDELGDLLRALGQMQSALRGLVGQVRSSTDNIGTASAEIAVGTQDLSARTEQTTSNLQPTASSMEEITATVKQSADIIGVIDGIAFQTNILALNAAVKAARAGEQGRGFAVVASEVRSLAQRSAEAAKEIKGLIGSSVEKVEGGTRMVTDAGATMTEIVNSVKRVSDIIGEITAASGEQSQGIGEINNAVAQLDQMTQQNAALVEQSTAAAESLKEQAVRLAQVVGTFRLER